MFLCRAFQILHGDEGTTVVVADFVNRRSRAHRRRICSFCTISAVAFLPPDVALVLSENEEVPIGGAGPIGTVFVLLGLSLLPPKTQA
jgi:hypothetical protein